MADAASRRLQRDRRGGSYVFVPAKGQPWRHVPRRWTLPVGGPKVGREDRMRAYIEDLSAYRVWLLGELRADPTFLDALRGRRLACPCRLEVRCPTDILVEQLAATA
jgi:hypothetical protein